VTPDRDGDGSGDGRSGDGRSTDGLSGTRIARLLASELLAREDGPLARLDLVDVRDAEALDPDAFGAFAYGVVAREGPATDATASAREDGDDERDTRRIADVHVHDDRARVEFRVGLDAVPAAAAEADLRVRPKAVDPPRALVFVEDGGAVKRVLPVVRAALRASDDEARSDGPAANGDASGD
jgi:hypothetical protein